MDPSVLAAFANDSPSASKDQLVEHSANRRALHICVAQKHAFNPSVECDPTNGHACHRLPRHCFRHAPVPAQAPASASSWNTRQSDEPDEFVLRKNTPASQAST